MAKLYSECPQKSDSLNPNEETVSFLLNYSKALNVIQGEKRKYETLLN